MGNLEEMIAYLVLKHDMPHQKFQLPLDELCPISISDCAAVSACDKSEEWQFALGTADAAEFIPSCAPLSYVQSVREGTSVAAQLGPAQQNDRSQCGDKHH